MYYNNKRITKTISGMMVPSWWAVKMLTKMRWWQRMGKSRGKGPKRRVTSPATFPKTFLSIISWSFQNTSTFLYSKFWTIFNKLNWSSLTLGTKFKSVYSIVSINQFFSWNRWKFPTPNCRMFEQNELEE